MSTPKHYADMARLAARNATRVAAELEADDFVMASGYLTLLAQQTADLLGRVNVELDQRDLSPTTGPRNVGEQFPHAGSVRLVTPSLFLGAPPWVWATCVDNADAAVAVINDGGVAALPAGDYDTAGQVLRLIGLCEHKVAGRLEYARSGQLSAPCDCQPPRPA